MSIKEISIKYLTLFLLVPLVSLGQDCVYERNEVDKTSGRRVIETRPHPLHMNMARGYKIGYKKDGSSLYLIMELLIFNIQDVPIFKGQELLLIFDNDKKMTLHSVKDYKTEYDRKLGTSFVTALYKIDAQKLAILSKSTIRLLSVSFAKRYYEIECTQTRRKEKVMRLAKCVM